MRGDEAWIASEARVRAGATGPPAEVEALVVVRLGEGHAELEGQGVIETQQGRGSVVRPNASPLKKDSRRRAVADAIDGLTGAIAGMLEEAE